MSWPHDSTTSVAARFPLSAATTFGIGGPAAWTAAPRTAGEAATLLRAARGEGMEIRCVGMGANLLVADEGVGGLVLQTRNLDAIEIRGHVVVAGAGVTNGRILSATRERGLAGLECLVGYPGTLGGAVRMNAGGTPGYVGPRVEWVRGVDGAGRVVVRPGRECGFRYRGSDLGDLVVTEVCLRLEEATDMEVYGARCAEILRRKRASQPMHLPSAGCAWKNPPGDAAGRLVDAAGLKGLRVGGAEVSTLHANFIVNRGGATCADVLALMDEVRRRVHDASGVLLEREVIHWGDAALALAGR